MKLLGKPIADQWLEETKRGITKLPTAPTLAIFQIGERAESTAYINRKVAAAKHIGVDVEVVNVAISESSDTAVEIIASKSANVTGAIVQLPVPTNMNRARLLDAIPGDKDVDGLSRVSLGALVRNEATIMPATPRAIIRIIQQANRKIEGLRVAVVGAGLLVGKPLALTLTNMGATVILIEKNERGAAELCKQADVLVASAGQPGIITPEFVHSSLLVIDAGFTVTNGKLRGDVDPAVEEYCEALTPVPGGVGPVTVAALMANLLALAEQNK